ncbi:GIY-YIG nuclease family protein [Bacillus infantis]|uniref:GIY-YIG nuclease family protein n=1 Tax=Bacillus infantis TaxID=324767 RepID=UPI00101D9B7D|nr:GIY-YIG nuclease family protein [Bacillus infantis]RYI29620.1 GIY-YIG nuclease family protein [Bacillus infantis]
MDRRKELKNQFKEVPVEAGVFQIKNKHNHKMFIGSTRNLKTLNGLKFSLETGSYVNKPLQEDWRKYGMDAFEISVIEVLKKKEDPYYNEKEALAEMEEKWHEHFQPYGEKGYHTPPNK